MTGNYILKDTPSGRKTLIFHKNREIRIHSAYDPEREAERSADNFTPGRASVIIVCGLGLGYHVAALKSRFSSMEIIVLEHDPEVALIAAEANPNMISGIRIVHSPADLPGIFEKLNMENFRGAATYVHRPSYMLYREFYDSIAADIRQYISSKISDLLTRFEFEEKWVLNILENLKHLESSCPVRNLFGSFRGYPGIIVSAGPSLRYNVDILKEVRDRALILSVDTAVRVLNKRKVRPHIVMTLDAQNYSMKHFLGMPQQGQYLLADLVSYHGILRDYRGRKILSTTSKYFTEADGSLQRETTPLVDWIEKYYPGTGDIQSGGSVATSAFDMLLNLGCDPIILVGQDLAYTGREIHCSGTYHNDEWLPGISRLRNLDSINQGVVRKRKIKHVQAYGGEGTVVSDFVFDLYRGWFEDSAQRVSATVINATGGGARIANTKEQSLEDLSLSMKMRKATPDQILEKAFTSSGSPDTGKLRQALYSAISSLSRIREEVKKQEQGKGDIEGLEELLDEDIEKILNPSLRKTRTYIARNQVPPEKSREMMIAGIEEAAERLIPALTRSLDTLEKGSKTTEQR